MIQRIDNICAVHYTTLDQINSIDLPLGGPAVIDTTWQKFDISPGVSLLINRESTNAGEQVEVKLNAGMRSSFNLKKLLLIKITLEDGTSLIIGDTDLPVRIEEDHTLKNKTISFTHRCWHYPYELSYASGSGSALGSGGL